MDEVCELVVTAPDEAWMAEFTRSLVDRRLAACGHILTPIRAIYRWSGKVEDEQEVRVALHTRLTLVDRIVDEANQRHSYKVPCVIATPIVGGNPAYLRWVLDETDADAAGVVDS
ncbi:divalent-cation tolerance protein CutA [Nakamurella deserti]|uniref:divalent-cation tolerance protein CutA n=1 Tax=Nakamurella deserti TaxID=2164074 RepID=UPI000DBE91CE|nr:divalent-cation tolerance protein CutA [Nakamurella deserti]